MIKKYKERIIDFLEMNGCEDVQFGMETEEGVAISYVFASMKPWNNQFHHCEIMIKDLEYLPGALQQVADDFNINKKICDMVVLAEDNYIEVAALVELLRDLHTDMEELAKYSEDFVEEVLQNESQNTKLIASVYEEWRELNENDEYDWTESTDMTRTFNTNYVNRFIDWLSEYQYNDEIWFQLSNGEDENSLDRVIEELSNGTMKMKDLDGCGIQCLRRSSGQWNQQVMQCTFKFKEIEE